MNIFLADPVFFSFFLLPNYLLVFKATVSKLLIQQSFILYICMMNCVTCDHFCQLIWKSLQNKFILRLTFDIPSYDNFLYFYKLFRSQKMSNKSPHHHLQQLLYILV